jgi:ABC-2 type transport system ATP-binding protein
MIIEVQDLVKHYGKVTAVDGVSFSVEKGEIFGFLGPNGAGKTTTINMLITVLKPTDGRASVLDFDIAKQLAMLEMSSASCHRNTLQMKI